MTDDRTLALLAFDRAAAGQLVVAVRLMRRWCRDNYLRLDPALDALEAHATAQTRTQPQSLDGSGGAPEPERMVIVLLTLDEVADALRVSRRKAESLVASGQLPSVKIDGARRVHRDDLDAYLDALRQDSADG